MARMQARCVRILLLRIPRIYCYPTKRHSKMLPGFAFYHHFRCGSAQRMLGNGTTASPPAYEVRETSGKCRERVQVWFPSPVLERQGARNAMFALFDRGSCHPERRRAADPQRYVMRALTWRLVSLRSRSGWGWCALRLRRGSSFSRLPSDDCRRACEGLCGSFGLFVHCGYDSGCGCEVERQ